MENVETLDRRAVILDAAHKVFLNYGFRRATMSDIADAAGISRPALYLEFKNKADIFRAGFQSFVQRTFSNVDRILADDGKLVDRLVNALRAAFVEPMKELAGTPHGMELLDVKQELAGDIGRNWTDVLQTSIDRTLRIAVENGEIDFASTGVTTDSLARLMVFCIDGLKAHDCEWRIIEEDLRSLVVLMVGPLTTHAGVASR